MTSRRSPVPLGLVTTTTLALMPDFLDPLKLIEQFGTWLWSASWSSSSSSPACSSPPCCPATPCCSWRACSPPGPPHSADVNADFQLWQLLLFIPPLAAVLGGQVGYVVGRFLGTAMFKPNARILKQRYLDEAHLFFEQRGPFAIVLARFVPIVRTWPPITAGAAKMKYTVFTLYNVIGAVLWGGVGLTLLGYGLGQFAIIQKLLEPIFILIAVASISPMIWEWYKRRRSSKAADPVAES